MVEVLVRDLSRRTPPLRPAAREHGDETAKPKAEVRGNSQRAWKIRPRGTPASTALSELLPDPTHADGGETDGNDCR